MRVPVVGASICMFLKRRWWSVINWSTRALHWAPLDTHGCWDKWWSSSSFPNSLSSSSSCCSVPTPSTTRMWMSAASIAPNAPGNPDSCLIASAMVILRKVKRLALGNEINDATNSWESHWLAGHFINKRSYWLHLLKYCKQWKLKYMKCMIKILEIQLERMLVSIWSEWTIILTHLSSGVGRKRYLFSWLIRKSQKVATLFMYSDSSTLNLKQNYQPKFNSSTYNLCVLYLYACMYCILYILCSCI